jgi:hypothetical protein
LITVLTIPILPEFHIPDSDDDQEEAKPGVPVKQLVDLVVRGSTLHMDHGTQVVDLVFRDSIRIVHDIRLDMGSWKRVAIGFLLGLFFSCILQFMVVLIAGINMPLAGVKALN